MQRKTVQQAKQAGTRQTLPTQTRSVGFETTVEGEGVKWILCIAETQGPFTCLVKAYGKKNLNANQLTVAEIEVTGHLALIGELCHLHV